MLLLWLLWTVLMVVTHLLMWAGTHLVPVAGDVVSQCHLVETGVISVYHAG